MIPQDVQSAISGLQQGKMAMAGVLPSAQNAGGAASPNVDPASPMFESSRRSILVLINYLHQQRDEHDANRVMKLMTQLQDIAMERRKKMAEHAADSMSSLSAVGNLNAMGVPNSG
jgi:hypothetical protein